MSRKGPIFRKKVGPESLFSRNRPGEVVLGPPRVLVGRIVSEERSESSVGEGEKDAFLKS